MRACFVSDTAGAENKTDSSLQSSVSWQYQLANRNPIINSKHSSPQGRVTVFLPAPTTFPCIYLEPGARPHLQKNLLGPKIGRTRRGRQRAEKYGSPCKSYLISPMEVHSMGSQAGPALNLSAEACHPRGCSAESSSPCSEAFSLHLPRV